MQFFITATGTEIGKTFILTKLSRKLLAQGKKVDLIKPIISGFESDDPNSDSAKILKILQLDLNQKNLDKISPYRFSAPLSPNIAADLENKKINFLELTKFCQDKIDEAKKNNHYLLIEGAGGIMTPINDDKTFADLISALKIPAILVAGNYLGTISHTLSSIKTLESQGIKIDRIIFNQKVGEVDDFGNLETLKKFTNIEIVCE
jgi:dethiobiotin synthetase